MGEREKNFFDYETTYVGAKYRFNVLNPHLAKYVGRNPVLGEKFIFVRTI